MISICIPIIVESWWRGQRTFMYLWRMLAFFVWFSVHLHNYSMLEQLDSLGNKTHIIESKRLSHVYWYTRMSSPSPSFVVTWRARASLVLCNVTLLFVTWSHSPQHPKTGFCRNLNAHAVIISDLHIPRVLPSSYLSDVMFTFWFVGYPSPG